MEGELKARHRVFTIKIAVLNLKIVLLAISSKPLQCVQWGRSQFDCLIFAAIFSVGCQTSPQASAHLSQGTLGR